MTNDFNPIEPESVEQAAISPETVRETRLPDGSPTPELTEGDPKRDGAAAPLTRRKLYMRRFMRNKGGVLGLVILLGLIVFSIVGGFFTQWNYTDPDFLTLQQGPGGSHFFGTNQAGNDTYAQAVHGLQRSIIIGVSVSALTTIISAIVGAWAAYVGGRLEKLTLGLIHFLLVVPSFLILALISTYFQGDWRVLIFVLTLFGWVFSARIVWTISTSVREREYVAAAEFMGVPTTKVVLRHVIPNIGSLLIVNFTLGVVSTIMSETGLSFLGFGIKQPDVSLGSMLADGANSVYSAPWLFAFPSLLLVMLTVSMALIGDGLRDALAPNSKAGGNA